LVELEGYLYRGIGRTYVSLPGRAGGLPLLIKNVLRIISISFLIIFLSSFFVAAVSVLSLNKNIMIQKFAIWADFNSNHLCTDDWSKNTTSVVFLGGDRVLAYMPLNKEGARFSSQTCNFKKQF